MTAFDRAFTLLADNPRLGPPVIGSGLARHRWPCGSHHIYYRVDRTTLYVINILHNRMDAPRHLR